MEMCNIYYKKKAAGSCGFNYLAGIGYRGVKLMFIVHWLS